MKRPTRHIALMLAGMSRCGLVQTGLRRHGRLLSVCLLLLMLGTTACHHDEDENAERPVVLTIYVYPPDRPMATRAGEADVEALEQESKVTKLQIWVFEHATDHLVGYTDADIDTLNRSADHQAAYEMELPEWFIVDRPNVDVYVFANVTKDNSGVGFGQSAKRTELHDATLNQNFGLKNSGQNQKVTLETLPADGIPMTGVLIDQSIGGEAPRLFVGDNNDGSIANIRLVRVTSKVRFVFGRPQEAPPLNITGISIDGGMIPEVEYLVAPPPLTCRVGSKYEGESPLIGTTLPVTTECPTPADYVVESGDAQTYDTKIQEAISDSLLTANGPYYLRESDRRITGKIQYKVGDGDVKTAAFAMASTGDFARNHSWIVYAYYSSGETLEVNTVKVDDWTDDGNEDHNIYNW